MTVDYSAFFYGSLMSNVVLMRVLLGAEATDDAKSLKLKSIRLTATSLQGYQRSCIAGEDYPAIIYTGKDSVQGVLCQGLTKKDILSLDTFEGDWYKRVPVKVKTKEGIEMNAETYVYIGDLTLLTGVEWDFNQFLINGKEQKWLEDRCEFFEVDVLHAQ